MVTMIVFALYYLVQARHSVGPVLGHEHRLVIFLMPGFSLPLNSVDDHVHSTGVTVPSIVTIEANNVEKLASVVLLKFIANMVSYKY